MSNILIENSEQIKLKKFLQKYLKSKGIIVKLSEIQHTGSWREGEFRVNSRIYHVDDLRQVQYGSSWYEYHEYTDYEYNHFRVSMNYHFYGLSSEERCLSLGCENIFTWSKRTANYKKKTDAQLDRIVESYISEYIRSGSPGNADIDVLRRTIKYELGKLYKKLWFEK